MTEWTQESLDALIDGLEGKITAPGEYSPEWISGFRIGEQALADAILASQPERVECPTKHRDSYGNLWGERTLWGKTFDFCPDCGRSLKGAGDK